MSPVKEIDCTAILCNTPKGICIKDSITYRFIYDSVENKLLKVAVANNNTRKKKEYYFKNDRLIVIRGGHYLISYFFDYAFSYGNIYKNKEAEEEARERDLEIATSYKFLIAFNRMQHPNSSN